MSDVVIPEWTGVRRPARADARRNFDALLEAARDVFAERGFDASLEEIARRAGVGIGTLYRNFPTRDQLLEAVYVNEIEALVRVAREASDLEPWESFTTWLDRFVAYVGTKKALIDGLNRESGVLDACRVVMYEAGRPLLERAQTAGAVRTDVGIEDVVRMVAGVAGVAYPEPDQRDRVVGIAVDGLRAR
ncbi:TetR/AcrR family transcriptional regulator [Agromyces protaetiae]|uniref:TetR/AcrR family transcriptional regulator n=1 Tax=Agromyces protaetiae TaxID=2509455 RepID=UPI001FB60739|nr:helix-turn-helix domain-containing protein [Agromyces protaetiae]